VLICCTTFVVLLSVYFAFCLFFFLSFCPISFSGFERNNWLFSGLWCLQYELLSEAVAASGREDIAQFLYEVKQKFEPGRRACPLTRLMLAARTVVEQLPMYYGSGTGGRCFVGSACLLTRWRHFSTWNYVMTSILKLWRHIRNPTPAVDAYLLEVKSCKI